MAPCAPVLHSCRLTDAPHALCLPHLSSTATPTLTFPNTPACAVLYRKRRELQLAKDRLEAALNQAGQVGGCCPTKLHPAVAHVSCLCCWETCIRFYGPVGLLRLTSLWPSCLAWHTALPAVWLFHP